MAKARISDINISIEKDARCTSPAESHLGREDIQMFTRTMQPAIMKSLYSKNPRLALAAHQCVRLLTSMFESVRSLTFVLIYCSDRTHNYVPAIAGPGVSRSGDLDPDTSNPKCT